MPSSRSADIALLYDQHHRWLVGWLKRRLNGGDEALDLTQDTFLKLLDRPQLLDEVREPRAWLVTVAQRLMINQARRRKLELAWREMLAQMPEPEVPSPEHQLSLLQVLDRLDAMLDGLNPKARAAYLLSRLDGLPYTDIAARLGVSVSSVEKYMVTAIRHCYVFRQSL